MSHLSSEAPPPPEPPLSPLKAEIIAPDDARRGERLRYFVRLTNAGEKSVSLEPCPAYFEGFKGEGESHRSYELNCSKVRAIPANSSVTYEMFLDVPTELEADGAGVLFTWGLDQGDRYLGPSANTWVELRA